MISKEQGERNLQIWKEQQKRKPINYAGLFEMAFRSLAKKLAAAYERKKASRVA